MKVLMLDPDPIGYYGTELCNALGEQSLSVRLLTAKGYRHRSRSQIPVVEVAPPSEPGRFGPKLRDELRYVLRIFREVMVWRPDIVHVQWLRVPAEVAMLALLRLLGCRVVWTAHTVGPRADGFLGRGVYWAIYRLARRIVVHSPSTLKEISKGFGVREAKCEVIPHGHRALSSERRVSQWEARAQLGIDGDQTVFLLFGQLRGYKGYMDLLEAFSEAAASSREICLVIAGRATEPIHAEVHEFVSSLSPDIGDRVVLRVTVGQVVDDSSVDLLFAAADCVVLPYKQISQSSVLLEARGYGKAVIAAAVGGLPDAVRDGIDGSLYPANDRKALAQLLVHWGSRRGELAQQGNLGREYAEERFAWDRVAQATAASYVAMLDGRTRSRT